MDTWVAPDSEFPPPKVGEPPLHRAARLGDGDAIRRLATGGADINALFDIGLDPGARPSHATPLMMAAGSCDGATADTVSLLLELGADPSVSIEERSAATFACMGLGWNYKPGGDAERLRLLLEAGSPLPTAPQRLNRLLCETAATGDVARLRILLSHGLDAREYFDPQEAMKSERAALNLLAEFRESQPDPFSDMPEDARTSLVESMREMVEQFAEQNASAPWSTEIPLFRAAESGNAECVRLLLDAGADSKARDNSKRTAMYYANSITVVRELMKAGLPLEDADEFDWSPLCSALSDGEEGLPRVHALIEAGADVNATHDHGYTIFMSAVGSGRVPDVLRLLVASGADPHAVSERGYNAFHAAIDVNGEANTEESVRGTLSYLKQLGVDIEQRNEADQTPLARAIQEGTGIEVRVLCELGANPNAVCPKHQCNGEGCTRIDLPLLFHAVDGIGVDKDEKTRALLGAGADPLAIDDEGHTPLVRAVASLCWDAPDYGMSFETFFNGLWQLRLEGKPMPKTREDFIAEALPVIRAYVERFAAGLPISNEHMFAKQFRTEKIVCIALLCAYEGWSRREHSRRNNP